MEIIGRSPVAPDALVSRALQAIAGSADLPEAFEAFGEVVHSATPFDRAGFLVRLHGRRFRVLVGLGADVGRLPPGRVLDVDGPERWRRFQAGCAFVREDLAAENLDDIDHILFGVGLRSYVSIPMVIDGEVQAVITFSSARPRAIGAESVGTFEALVRATATTFNKLLLLDDHRAAVIRLEALDILKNEFVATVAHDLRSPMTVVAGLARMLLAQPDRAPERRAEILARIVTNVESLSGLVTDVLDVAHIESGEFEYHPEVFDLSALLRRTLEETATLQPGRPWRSEVPDGLPQAFGDVDRYKRVLTNLLSNAFKYSPASAPVVLCVLSDPAGLRVRISDGGAGIDSGDLPRLFHRFSRLEPPAGGQAVPGSGLGLYICRQIIEAQGGRIWAESTPGKGSTFQFTIPCAGGGQGPAQHLTQGMRSHNGDTTSP